MPEQRLFFALWPSQDLVKEIVRIKQGLPEHSGRLHHPEDLHMTLVFLGAVEPEKLDCVQRAADVIQAKPFTLQLNQIGHWPRPRILWLGSPEAPESLSTLVKDLQSGLADCGFKPERRPYKPHITLARKAKRISPATLEKPLQWLVQEFVLAGSSLGDKPPRYQILKRWKLSKASR